MWSERRIYGSTHTVFLRRPIAPSRWMWALRIVCISNLNIRNRNIIWRMWSWVEYIFYWCGWRSNTWNFPSSEGRRPVWRRISITKVRPWFGLRYVILLNEVWIGDWRRIDYGWISVKRYEFERFKWWYLTYYKARMVMKWFCIFAGETIPIRLFLGGFDLTPTFREVNKKFSTRYYLSLVLIDEGKSFEALIYPILFQQYLHLHCLFQKKRNARSHLPFHTILRRSLTSQMTSPLLFSTNNPTPNLYHYFFFKKKKALVFLKLSSSHQDQFSNSIPSDARRYFKQSEIVLYRQTPDVAAQQLQPQPQSQPQSQPQQITSAAWWIRMRVYPYRRKLHPRQSNSPWRTFHSFSSLFSLYFGLARPKNSSHSTGGPFFPFLLSSYFSLRFFVWYLVRRTPTNLKTWHVEIKSRLTHW